MPPGCIAIVAIRGDHSKTKMAAVPTPQQFYPNCADKIASRCFDPPMRRGAYFLKIKPLDPGQKNGLGRPRLSA